MRTITVQSYIYKSLFLTALFSLLVTTSVAATISTESRKIAYREVVDKSAVLLNGSEELQSKIRYPKAALQAGFEGQVIARVYINESGRVDDVDFIKKMGGGFETAVKKAIMESRYIPAIHNNQPVKSVSTISFKFQIKKN